MSKAQNDSTQAVDDKCGCSHDKPCVPRIPRRDILRAGGVAAAGLLTGAGRHVMAGPFTAEDFEKLVPADKRLSTEWVRSLFERGEPETYGGKELQHIGMAIGGICCGHVYLGGDGKLWHWDIFNEAVRTGAAHYRDPLPVQSEIDQGFQIRVGQNGRQQVRSLDAGGFDQIRFRGAYPFGFVDYAAEGCPVRVTLEAFSPFSPLDVDNSSLPLTVMRYTVRNTSQVKVECDLVGHLRNPILKNTGTAGGAIRVNQIQRLADATCLTCRVVPAPKEETVGQRPDIVFDDFETDGYGQWTVEGTAFGDRPIVASKMPGYQGDVAAHGKQLVNSHNTRSGEEVRAGDDHVGRMTSKDFTVERRFINFLIGGGSHKGETCLNLVVDGKVALSMTGRNENRLRPGSFSVGHLLGKTAHLEIVDQRQGGWGNIGVDWIVFSDKPSSPQVPLEQRADYGDMTLALVGAGEGIVTSAGVPETDASRFETGPDSARGPIGEEPTGMVGRHLVLEPGEEATVSFAIAWRFANTKLPPAGEGHYYATRFASSLDAIRYLAQDFDSLHEQTRLWHETWYDSTLPYWLLDRTFINISTLATGTCRRFSSGRFWGWEGVGCCAGTCTHVWHYAQSIGRLFPELERITREHVDYGLAYHEDGQLDYRGEFAKHVAVDGQCGTILRVLREHQMSADGGFLRRIWPRVRKSIEYLILQDGDDNGILEGSQYNTLDAAWFGTISWISSLYVAALRAGTAMASEMGDDAFADKCQTLADRGGKWMTENLFNGQYYYQKRDPGHPEAFGAGIGCHIDQVFGQGWAHQVNLPRVLPVPQTVTALKSLWRYNFTPDVGPYRERFQAGRWYAMPGEAGLIMCTFPLGGEKEARGGRAGHTFAGYLNECMNGFEYQAAGHMIAEGLVQEGLAVTRAIHDRYHASRRNPYNEIECGDHYARSMASHGVFISVCGFEYHGPKAHIGFAPKLSADDFRAPFVAAQGWGTFEQQRGDRKLTAALHVKSGKVRLRTISLQVAAGTQPRTASVKIGDQPVGASLDLEGDRATVRLQADAELSAGTSLAVSIA